MVGETKTSSRLGKCSHSVRGRSELRTNAIIIGNHRYELTFDKNAQIVAVHDDKAIAITKFEFTIVKIVQTKMFALHC